MYLIKHRSAYTFIRLKATAGILQREGEYYSDVCMW